MKGSLRRKLPAIMGALLVAAVGVFGAFAFFNSRASALADADGDLADVTSHVVTLLADQFRREEDLLRRIGMDTLLANYLVDQNSMRDAELVRHLATTIRGNGRIEVRDSLGYVILRSSDRSTAERPAMEVRGDTYDTVGTGRLSMVADSIFIEKGAPILHHGRRVGSIAVIRRQALAAASAGRITGFIGPHANVLVGNTDGSLWIDLAGRVHPRPEYERTDGYTVNGERRLGTTAPIVNSKLSAAVDVPLADALDPVNAMLRPLFVIAMVVVVGGALLGWALSRRITEPLAALTTASRALAAYDFDRGAMPMPSLPTHRDDEIGVLSQAFETMSQRVHEARSRLESQVDERTAELKNALHLLQNAQEELVRKERLATLGQLSSSVGHELRNPLGVMTNAAYLLEVALQTNSDKAPHYLQMIRSQIGLSEKIVSDLLDFARVRSPELSEVEVIELVDEQLQRVLLPDGMQVRRDVEAGLPRLNIDRVQIGQVLFNLVTNAIQAMQCDEKEHTLTISAKRDDAMIRIDVVDDGPGMSSEQLARVFEPLFTTKARGIGLGLSVSQSLVEANGGSLRARSAPGAGATFTVLLPVAGP